MARFVEKPDLGKAEAMLKQGGFYWNSGMFMLGVGTFLAECKALSPESFEAAQGAVENARSDLDFVRLDEASFAKAPNISVDYAIFERTKLIAMIPVSFHWSDLGSWDAVWKVSTKDGGNNAVMGEATLSNTTNSLVVTEKAHVAVEGLDDVAVIATEDAVYVGKLSEAQKVGPMVKALKLKPDTVGITEIHRTAYRPWGGYSSVLNGARFQVKRLFVKPGKKLSLQKHHHRAEHWIVVSGHRRGHHRRHHHDAERERVDLPAARLRPPPRQSGQDPARTDRSADRLLSGRRRHHPHRGRVRAGLTGRIPGSVAASR